MRHGEAVNPSAMSPMRARALRRCRDSVAIEIVLHDVGEQRWRRVKGRAVEVRHFFRFAAVFAGSFSDSERAQVN